MTVHPLAFADNEIRSDSKKKNISKNENPSSGCASRVLFGVRGRRAVIAQLGERETEDLEVPGSIPGHGSLVFSVAKDSLG